MVRRQACIYICVLCVYMRHAGDYAWYFNVTERITITNYLFPMLFAFMLQYSFSFWIFHMHIPQNDCYLLLLWTLMILELRATMDDHNRDDYFILMMLSNITRICSCIGIAQLKFQVEKRKKQKKRKQINETNNRRMRLGNKSPRIITRISFPLEKKKKKKKNIIQNVCKTRWDEKCLRSAITHARHI